MDKVPIEKVSLEESNSIETIFRRGEALKVLVRTIAESDIENRGELYDTLVADLASNLSEYAEWWGRMDAKYHFQNSPGGQWEVNFSTGQIYLVSKNMEKIPSAKVKGAKGWD